MKMKGMVSDMSVQVKLYGSEIDAGGLSGVILLCWLVGKAGSRSPTE